MKRNSNKRATDHNTSNLPPSMATQSRESSWIHGVAFPALLSSLALWAAFPPLGMSLLAWIAPAGWLLIADRSKPVGRAGYFVLWLSGCVYWLAILQGIRLAFWPLYFGWIALSLYLAIYTPLFVGLVRSFRTQWGWKLPVAAPIAWVSLELLRAYMLSGYAANSLAHSQALVPVVIQIADQVGGYGVSFVMMAVCSSMVYVVRTIRDLDLTRSIRWKRSLSSGSLATVLLVITLGYGSWRLNEASRLATTSGPTIDVLLIQENTPTIFEFDPDKNQAAWNAYVRLTREAVQEHGMPDLIVWPESTFTGNEPLLELELTDGLPQELIHQKVDQATLQETVDRYQQLFRFKIDRLFDAIATGRPSSRPATVVGGAVTKSDAAVSTRTSNVHESRSTDAEHTDLPFLLLGCDRWLYTSEQLKRMNSALFVSPQRELAGRYAKMHLVMFGEYIPLGPLLSWLGSAFGMGTVVPGEAPECFEVRGVKVSPNICFESMVPRLINRQVRELAATGDSPDVLINLTNDSWFRGSTILDHHLACSILCAVENRRPLLVAANTGLSAEIDCWGNLLQVSPRLKPATIKAAPIARRIGGLVQSWGYPFAWLCGGTSLSLIVYALAIGKRRERGAF